MFSWTGVQPGWLIIRNQGSAKWVLLSVNEKLFSLIEIETEKGVQIPVEKS